MPCPADKSRSPACTGGSRATPRLSAAIRPAAARNARRSTAASASAPAPAPASSKDETGHSRCTIKAASPKTVPNEIRFRRNEPPSHARTPRIQDNLPAIEAGNPTQRNGERS